MSARVVGLYHAVRERFLVRREEDLDACEKKVDARDDDLDERERSLDDRERDLGRRDDEERDLLLRLEAEVRKAHAPSDGEVESFDGEEVAYLLDWIDVVRSTRRTGGGS